MKLKKLIVMSITCLLCLSVFTPATVFAEPLIPEDDIGRIIYNLDEYLKGNDVINNNPLSAEKIKAINTAGKQNIPNFDHDGNAVYAGVELDNTNGTDYPVAKLSANIETTYKNLYAVALAYATPGSANNLYQDAATKDALIDALEWVHEKYLKDTDAGYYGNWYSWEIGMPMNLSKILFLLRDDIEMSFINDSITMMDAYIRGDEQLGSPLIGDVNLDARQHTGANLTDITFNRIIQGALTGDVARVDKAVSDMMTVFKTIDPNNIEHGVTDGFYEDGSFIQHSTVAYTGSYGKVLLTRIAQLVTTLDGTRWQDDSLMGIVQDWVYRGFAPVMYEGYMMEIVKGRAVSRTGTGYADAAGVVEALVQLSLGMEADDQFKLQSYIKYLDTIPKLVVNTKGFVSVSNIFAFSAILNDDTIPATNPLNLNQHYAFNLMDKSVHMREDYGFALSRSSNRVSKYEYMSGENLRSWFQGDGAYYLYQSGVDQTEVYGIDYFATVDHYKLPGITTVNEQRQTMPELYGTDFYLHEPEFTSGSVAQNKYVYFPLGTNDYSGSAQLETYAVSGMQLGDEQSYADRDVLPDDFVIYKNAEANKSWFMFDNEIVVLGSNIHDSNNRAMTTTIENKMFAVGEDYQVKTDVAANAQGIYQNLKWLAIDSGLDAKDVGYVFHDNNDITIQDTSRTGRYSTVRNKTTGSADKEVTKNYVTATYEHSEDTTSSYAYSIVPNTNAENLENYAQKDAITVLKNTEDVHAVSQNELGIKGYVFFSENGSVEDITAQDRLIMMRKNNTFSIQDPTHQQETVSFTIDGSYAVESGDATSEIVNGKTTISVNTFQKNGVSQVIELVEKTIEENKDPITLTDEASGVSVTFAHGVLPADTSLSVRVDTERQIRDLSDVVVYDITLQASGATVQPSGNVDVSIKTSKAYNDKLVVLHRVGENAINVPAQQNGAIITFKTDSFSEYIVGRKDGTTPPTVKPQPPVKPDDNGGLPGTGVASSPLIPIGLAVVLSGIVLINVRRKQSKA
ncbi:polysaccharide lyase 8 family protein [Erysipelothrix sp. HDW6C]|uniref:polysaccharide lyase 8 family protein n=1 Tax=Erysipelothrix sp. HDW6C TaxID=2714930 RepID=UPI001408347A|nr:polysaccharide lyase 8 family protein [Erysipelothrix sp. HDW6C]QIK69266.1 polysaccharide lyase 8 family protein [Erysipelothrix sp. HDW6C]